MPGVNGRFFNVYEVFTTIVGQHYIDCQDLKMSTPLFFTPDGWRLVTEDVYRGKVTLSGNDCLLKTLKENGYLNDSDKFFYKVWEDCSIEVCFKGNHCPAFILCEGKKPTLY
jgi:hypothetical protein